MRDLPPPTPPSTGRLRPPEQPGNSVLALILADQQERWQRGERPLVESYLERWPMIGADPDKALDLIYHEFLLREQQGESPDPDEYHARFPPWADDLRLLFEVHRAMPPDEMRPAAGDDRPRCVLDVIKGPHLGRRIDLDEHRTLLVGRGSQTQLRLLDDAHVSRYHFLLEISPPVAYLRDLGSRNGTWVRGERARACRLRDGDAIVAGQSQIHFTMRDRPEAVPPGPAAEPAPAIPGYEIVRPLGRGRAGGVYLARCLSTGEPMMLRVIPAQAADEEALRRCLDALRVVTQLNHPRIVRVRETGLVGGQLFVARVYVPAALPDETLAGRAEAERIRACGGLLCQALEGLAAAHSRNLVHGNFNPSRVLICRPGEQVEARVADVGITRALVEAGLAGLIHEGATPATYAFQAPELVLDARPATPAADVYAAGATLYWLLAGTYPHDFEDGLDPLLVVLETPPVPLRHRCPAVPPALADVVGRALARDPRQRFPTAEALRQALLPHSGR